MTTWIASRHFPHTRFRGVGTILVVLGLAVAGIGIASVVYTEFHYGVHDSGCNKPDLDFRYDPCDPDIFRAIIYYRVGSGVWGGLFILLTGAIGTCFYDGDRSIKTRRDALGVLSFLLIFPICPAIIALSVVQLVFTESIFFLVNEDNQTLIIDNVMFMLPLVLGGLAFVAWCAAIAILIMVCSCADLYEDDTEIIKKYSRPNRPPPTIVNRFRPQFVPYYSDHDVYGSYGSPYSSYGDLPPFRYDADAAYGYRQPTYVPLPPARRQEARRMPYTWMTSRRYLRW